MSVAKFRAAIRDAGLQPPGDIIADGKLHRFDEQRQTWR
jgi:hypothetical protein